MARNPIDSLVGSIEARIASVWDTATGFWVRVGREWGTLRTYGQSLVKIGLQHAASTLLTLTYIVAVAIPRTAAQGLLTAVREARALAASAYQAGRADLVTVRDWLKSLVDQALAQVYTLGRWVTGEVNALRANTARVMDRIFGAWATPERLVAWAIDAIVDGLIGWTQDNAVRLGKRLVAARIQIMLTSLHLFEDIVSRIL